MSQLLSVIKVVASACVFSLLAGAFATCGQASSITVSNPTFNVTVDNTFTDNGNTYTHGQSHADGLLYLCPDGLRHQNCFDRIPVFPRAASAHSMAGPWPARRPFVGVQAPDVVTSGSNNVGDVGFFTSVAGGSHTGGFPRPCRAIFRFSRTRRTSCRSTCLIRQASQSLPS